MSTATATRTQTDEQIQKDVLAELKWDARVQPNEIGVSVKDGVPPDQQLARGKINVVLRGKKLCGGFTLVQTGRRPVVSSQGERWLLIKQRDEHVDASWDIESPEFDRSVLTGRTLKEIEHGRRTGSE